MPALHRLRALLAASLFAVACTPACDKNGQSGRAPAAAAKAAAQPGAVDALLAQRWHTAGITPAPVADDATFMRRAYLDLTGVVPTAAQARAFLDDTRADKRARLVDELVASPAWATHWTEYWDEVLMERARERRVDRAAFRQWLHGRLAAGAGWDAIVRELITASGVSSTGEERRRMPAELDAPNADGVNGAVNWLLTGAEQPQDLAGAASRVFLGVQIQCAECHDHPTEKWTQDDFRRFTAAFMRVSGRRVARDDKMSIPAFEVEDAERTTPMMRRRMRKTGYSDAEPRALDGTSLEGDSPRSALASWMTAKDNPWFSRALVNRMWGYFLGRGFVEPIDDFRAGQEVAAPELLEKLASDFAAGGYDLRQLMRVICTSAAYERAASGEGAALWSSFELRPMSDVQLLYSLAKATAIEPVLEEVAGERLPLLKQRLRREFRFTFGVDESADSDSFTGTVAQALMLLNGPMVAAASSALEGSTLGTAARLPGGAAATIEHLYLATLSRRPDADELSHWRAYLEQAEGKRAPRARGVGPVARVYRQQRLADLDARDVAYEDVLWALLNSSEFFFIH
jgi:hypothetical protein